MPASEPDNHSGTTEKSTSECPDDTVLEPSGLSEDGTPSVEDGTPSVEDGTPSVNEGEPSDALEDTVGDEEESELSEVERLSAEL